MLVVFVMFKLSSLDVKSNELEVVEEKEIEEKGEGEDE